jgi:ABC-type glycerol-3-phosphate transport system permease component
LAAPVVSSKARARLVTWPGWLLLGLVVIGPFYWIVASSFKGPEEIIRRAPTFFPQDIVTTSFHSLFSSTSYPTYLTNSLIVAVGTAVVTLAVATCGAYGLHRLRVPGGRIIGGAVLLSYMIPGTLLLVPLYRTMASLHIVNTLAALVIVNVAFTAPFCVWLLHGFLESIPRDLDEAAAVDGAGPLRTMVSIVLPLLTPGLATVGVYAFVYSWTEFVFASQLTVSNSKKTLPIGLSEIMGQYNINWGLLMAGAVFTILPAAIIFAVAGRYFVRGLVTGAVK